MNIFIMPNKLFINEFKDTYSDNIAVVICSSYRIDTSSLNGIGKKLILHFDDITTTAGNSFNIDIAKQIKSFVDTPGIETLYVCCDSGESRSSAIAASVVKYQKESDLYIWDNPQYHPNTLVYKIMCGCFGKRISGFKIRCLKQRNANALKNAIKRKRLK